MRERKNIEISKGLADTNLKFKEQPVDQIDGRNLVPINEEMLSAIARKDAYEGDYMHYENKAKQFEDERLYLHDNATHNLFN